jgi:hypothetical protein
MDRSTGADKVKRVPHCRTPKKGKDSVKGMNMCYVAPAGEVVFVWDDTDLPQGMSQVAGNKLKLGACQGDCDNDWDCDVSGDFCSCL